jgi:hypothetical protein
MVYSCRVFPYSELKILEALQRILEVKCKIIKYQKSQNNNYTKRP